MNTGIGALTAAILAFIAWVIRKVRK